MSVPNGRDRGPRGEPSRGGPASLAPSPANLLPTPKGSMPLTFPVYQVDYTTRKALSRYITYPWIERANNQRTAKGFREQPSGQCMQP